MEINWLWVVLFGAAWLISKMVQNSRETHTVTTQDQLTLRLQEDLHRLPDGTPLELVNVHLNGAVVVPADNYPAMIQISLWDVTDERNRLPIITSVADSQRPDGQFVVQHNLEIPYQQSSFNDIKICTIPLPLILAPWRGKRAIEIEVVVSPQGHAKSFFRKATTILRYAEYKIGYLEQRDHLKNSEKTIAALAAAFAAVDGEIADSEVSVITSFFQKRYAGSSEVEEVATSVREQITSTIEMLRTDHVAANVEVKRITAELRERNDEQLFQTAYELCLSVATADDVLQSAEQDRLAELAQLLDLSPQFVKEVNDRYIRVTMYTESADASAVGMPPGLDREQQKAYLAEEYRKWRGRTTHKDAAIAAEAAIRLEKIAQLRAKLEDATS